MEQLEIYLGLDAGKLTGNPHMVAYEIPPESLSELRIPSGNEGVAASPLWRPGGYTINGLPEAVIDQMPSSDLQILFMR